MKDGSMHRLVFELTPSGEPGQPPKPRLIPESNKEAGAREDALAAAHKVVKKMDREFELIDPIVYNYLVRIDREDGSSTDVWVDPDVDAGRFFYDLELQEIEDQNRHSEPSVPWENHRGPLN